MTKNGPVLAGSVQFWGLKAPKQGRLSTFFWGSGEFRLLAEIPVKMGPKRTHFGWKIFPGFSEPD